VQHTGVVAQATLLIDDAQANVRGAQSAGWQAIHFTTPGALREALRDLEVEGCGFGGPAEKWRGTRPVNLR
jgi:FMN phosphatase YigB (HAD superfamily)